MAAPTASDRVGASGGAPLHDTIALLYYSTSILVRGRSRAPPAPARGERERENSEVRCMYKAYAYQRSLRSLARYSMVDSRMILMEHTVYLFTQIVTRHPHDVYALPCTHYGVPGGRAFSRGPPFRTILLRGSRILLYGGYPVH